MFLHVYPSAYAARPLNFVRDKARTNGGPDYGASVVVHTAQSRSLGLDATLTTYALSYCLSSLSDKLTH